MLFLRVFGLLSSRGLQRYILSGEFIKFNQLDLFQLNSQLICFYFSQMLAGDHYYRCESDADEGTEYQLLNGMYWDFVLHRPSTDEIFLMKYREKTDTGHTFADGLEAWTRPAVRFIFY